MGHMWLVVDLDRDIMSVNFLTKCGNKLTKLLWLKSLDNICGHCPMQLFQQKILHLNMVYKNY